MAFGNEKCKEIIKNICPHCGQILIMNKRSFANHVRWCKLNPRYNEIKSKCIEKIKIKTKKKVNRTLNCIVCGNQYNIECTDKRFKSGKYKKTCCDECSKKLTVANTNHKEKIKKIKLKSNTKPIEIKICEWCNKEFETKKHHQRFCCKECAVKHRNYKYYSDSDPDEYLLKKLYKHCCDFKFALNEFPEEFDFEMINKYGWYKAKNRGNNLNGISRDHIYSKIKALENWIDPYIISHPANCQLLRHNDNISKYIGCDLTFEDLVSKIKDWHNKYGEYPNKIDYTIFKNNGIKFKTLNDI